MTARLAAFSALALLLVPAGPAASEDARLGRLFHTPEERMLLDRRASLVEEAPPAPESRSRRLDGIVRRSDGRATVWIDGHRASGGEATASGDARAATIALPDGERRRLRVGESIGGASGTR